MLKKSPIIILDEATAYTDPENEALIPQSVAKLVVDHGKIVQIGAHDTLLVEDGIYRRFVQGREQAVRWKL